MRALKREGERGRKVGVLHLLDFCHNSWPDLSNVARLQQHPQLAFQSIVDHVCWMPVVVSIPGWVTKVNRLSISFCCCCCCCLNLLFSTQTGSRCLKCLCNFVNDPKSLPPSLPSPQVHLFQFELNGVKNVHGTCQQMRMRVCMSKANISSPVETNTEESTEAAEKINLPLQ